MRRGLGGGVPEFWGQKSQYTEGTEFLGTPKDHMDRVRESRASALCPWAPWLLRSVGPAIERRVPSPRAGRRPLSPDVFDIKGSKPHYKFPLPAITSIANRVTGVTLSGEAAPRPSTRAQPVAPLACDLRLVGDGGPSRRPRWLHGHRPPRPDGRPRPCDGHRRRAPRAVLAG